MLSVRGSTWSDVARYGDALDVLGLASRAEGGDRDRSYAASMVGRVHLLRGALDRAEESLTRSIELARSSGWTGFLPWPQSLLGEVELQRGDVGAARRRLEEAFTLGCQIGDPCWEGVSARGLGRVLAAEGDAPGAIAALQDARARCTRLPDGYLWLDVWILDALCAIGVETGDPRAGAWAQEQSQDASRRGMRELAVRAQLHRLALDELDDPAPVAALALDIDNPSLHAVAESVLAAGRR